MKYGAKFQLTLCKEITHVITRSFEEHFIRNTNANVFVVTPQWILDCIREAEILCAFDYDVRALRSINLRRPKGRIRVLPNVKEETGTSKDANFLEKFMANSRLHHLSAWRSHFQEQLAKEIQVDKDYVRQGKVEGKRTLLFCSLRSLSNCLS